MSSSKDFTNTLISWYKENKRDLPWRTTQDPFRIWLSEIILQQTRVAQGISYYNKFIRKYANVHFLAEAPIDEVLRLWQGLGYYSRARNLHRCAQIVSEQYSGSFPNNYSALIKLPGIGHYTASAIASFCFNQPEAVVDGNVFRVLSRYFGIYEDISLNSGQQYFKNFAKELLPETQSSTYNQAIMEFGALQCKPSLPNCAQCPLNNTCFARNKKEALSLPVKSKKIKPVKTQFHYFVITFNGKYYLQKRTEGIWQGLYEFFLIEGKEKPPKNDLKKLLSFIDFEKVEKRSVKYTHQLTHKTIEADFYIVQARKFHEHDYINQLYTLHEIEQLPKPILIDRFFKEELMPSV